MNANTLRRLNWLWKHRHIHDGVDTLTNRVTIVEEIVREVDHRTIESTGIDHFGTNFVFARDTSDVPETQTHFRPDGTDDQVEIQEALDSLPSTGGELTFLAGEYVINGGVNVPAVKHVRLVGKGAKLIFSETAEIFLGTMLDESRFVFEGFEVTRSASGTAASVIDGAAVDVQCDVYNNYFHDMDGPVINWGGLTPEHLRLFVWGNYFANINVRRTGGGFNTAGVIGNGENPGRAITGAVFGNYFNTITKTPGAGFTAGILVGSTDSRGLILTGNIIRNISGIDGLVSQASASHNLVDEVMVAGSHTGITLDHDQLQGLADDDHTQYLLANGTRAATFLKIAGLTGATAANRYVGGTASGAPASGTFQVGDYVVTQDGNVFICTVAGTPGTWVAVGAAAATDLDAIHDNVSGEISALTEVTPLSGDFLLIEDASDSNNKKRVNAFHFLSGGGGGSVPAWIVNLAARPTSAHADDDEFNDASLAGNWTAVTPTGSTTWSENADVLSGRASGLATSDIAGLVKAMTPTAPPVTIEVAARFLSPGQNFPHIGVLFANGTTATDTTLAARCYFGGTGNGFGYMTGTYTNAAPTFGSGAVPSGLLQPAPFMYIRVIWTAANSWKVRFSPDGVSWTDWGLGAISATLAPTHFGVFVSNWSGAEDVIGTFEYFRVTESDLS